MKFILALAHFLFSTSIFAAAKGDDFKEKYLFTHLPKAKAHPSKDEVSKCFKFNKPSKEVLQSYQSCRKDPKLPAPLDEAMGTCVRKDGANAYFFEDLQECNAARDELVEALADKEN